MSSKLMCPNVDHHFQPYPQSKDVPKREKRAAAGMIYFHPSIPGGWVARRALSQQINSLSQRCCFQNTNEQRFGWFKAKKRNVILLWNVPSRIKSPNADFQEYPIYSLRIKNGWKIPHSWMIFQARNLYFIADVPSKPPFIDDFPSIFPGF